MKLIADHPLLVYLEDAFAEADMEGFRTMKRALARKYPHVQMGIFFKSMEHMQSMTTFEPLDEEEMGQWQQKLEASKAEDEKNNIFVKDDVPMVVGQKNANKFTPHIGQFRSGQLATVSELVQMYQYVLNLREECQFGLAFDDRGFEDISVNS